MAQALDLRNRRSSHLKQKVWTSYIKWGWRATARGRKARANVDWMPGRAADAGFSAEAGDPAAERRDRAWPAASAREGPHRSCQVPARTPVHEARVGTRAGVATVHHLERRGRHPSAGRARDAEGAGGAAALPAGRQVTGRKRAQRPGRTAGGREAGAEPEAGGGAGGRGARRGDRGRRGPGTGAGAGRAAARSPWTPALGCGSAAPAPTPRPALPSSFMPAAAPPASARPAAPSPAGPRGATAASLGRELDGSRPKQRPATRTTTAASAAAWEKTLGGGGRAPRGPGRGRGGA